MSRLVVRYGDLLEEHDDLVSHEDSPIIEYVEDFYLNKRPDLYSRDKIFQITALSPREARHIAAHIEAVFARRAREMRERIERERIEREVYGPPPEITPKPIPGFKPEIAQKIRAQKLSVKRIRVRGHYYIYGAGKGFRGRIIGKWRRGLIKAYRA
jgi:hypothetical protein